MESPNPVLITYRNLDGIIYAISIYRSAGRISVKWECEQCKLSGSRYGSFADTGAATKSGEADATDHHLAKHAKEISN
jgi:hypothetical protein